MHSCIHKNNIHKWFSRNLETFFVNITGTMDQKRSIKKYTFRNSSAKELKELATLVPNLDNFKNRYGKLISILKTKVEKGIRETLVQFYDPVYHCFTFPDYQLMPTLEEYSYWIGLPVTDVSREKSLSFFWMRHLMPSLGSSAQKNDFSFVRTKLFIVSKRGKGKKLQ